MAPLPESNTARYFVDYEGPMGKRTIQFRSLEAGGTGQTITGIRDFLTILKPIIYSSVTFNGLRRANAGSNVSNPIAWAPITGNVAGTLPPSEYPRFFAFWGRSSDGRELKLTFYGGTLQVSDDFRLQRGENATLGTAIDFLNSGAGAFTTISGVAPTWKQYANSGYNAYHQRKRRTAV